MSRRKKILAWLLVILIIFGLIALSIWQGWVTLGNVLFTLVFPEAVMVAMYSLTHREDVTAASAAGKQESEVSQHG